MASLKALGHPSADSSFMLKCLQVQGMWQFRNGTVDADIFLCDKTDSEGNEVIYYEIAVSNQNTDNFWEVCQSDPRGAIGACLALMQLVASGDLS